MPASDSRLLSHIRKQHNRKLRRRAGGSDAGSEDGGGDGDGARSEARSGGASSGRSSGVARTARASDWGHSDVFGSDDEEGGGGGGTGGRSDAGRSVGGGARRGGRASVGGAPGVGVGGVRLTEGGDDPMDLLDAGSSRQLARSAARVGRASSTRADALPQDAGF
eukprot:21894-Chlamydomonas_euryale.AAC.1